jgi:hypothetical protein
VQDLRVAGAAIEGDDVIISVYGGTENVCGTVRFTFPDKRSRKRTMQLAERWRDADQLVTLLAANGAVSLFVERTLFEQMSA